MKRRWLAVVVLNLAAAAAVACGDSDGDGANADVDAGAVVPGNGNPDDHNDGGSVPTFNPTGANQPVVTDGAPPVFSFDAAVTQPPPLTTVQRGIWAVDSEHHLIRIIADDPTQVAVVAQLELAPNEQVIGLDFRPSNGMLYALTMPSSQLYTIDKTTAKLTKVGTPTTPAVQGQAYGFDFNPVADLLRIQSDVDQNLRINPNTGAVVGTDMALTFGGTDVNAGQSPNLVGSAYSNNTAGATSTVLYAIDSTRNLLTKVDPPNDGTVTTIGDLGVNVIEHVGFDILGASEAWAALRVEGTEKTGLYAIDLTTGAATLSGEIMHPIALRGIAIEP